MRKLPNQSPLPRIKQTQTKQAYRLNGALHLQFKAPDTEFICRNMREKRTAVMGVALVNMAILTSLLQDFYPHFSMQHYLEKVYGEAAVHSAIFPDYQGSIDLYKYEIALEKLGMESTSLRLDVNALQHFNDVNRTLAELSDQQAIDRARYVTQRLMGGLYPEFERIRAKVAIFQSRYDALVTSEGFDFDARGIKQIKNLQNSIFEPSELVLLFDAFNEDLQRYSRTKKDMFDVRQLQGQAQRSADEISTHIAN